jgi:hypothetical protein
VLNVAKEAKVTIAIIRCFILDFRIGY